MPFIKIQKLRTDEKGTVVSGSASVVDVSYVKDARHHSRQTIRECLGKVLWLAGDRRSGIFLSPARGLVEYSADTDAFDQADPADPRLEGKGLLPPPAVHTVFGDAHWLLLHLERSGMARVLRDAFPDGRFRGRLLLHLLHGVIRDGSRIRCDSFVAKSVLSHVFPGYPASTLRSDSPFFLSMGEDGARVAFFKAFAREMRKGSPDFGKACYVDSTPLPNDIADNPFNALCSHGTGSAEIQSRLVLVLDEATNLPVWFQVIPGNVLDVNTVRTVLADVSATLGISIGSMVLDAGYVSKEFVRDSCPEPDGGREKARRFIARMPARKGFPHKELWQTEAKPFISQGKYEFVSNGHTYFARRAEIGLFGRRLQAYVYVDRNNALARAQEYRIRHGEEVERMADGDRDWLSVRFGYFVLLSNVSKTPKEILADYFRRVDIEAVFKTAKDYLNLLPLSKWSDQAVRGKILLDIVGTAVRLGILGRIAGTPNTVTDIWSATQSLMCFRNAKGTLIVETPNRQVKEAYAILGEVPPSTLDIGALRKALGFTEK